MLSKGTKITGEMLTLLCQTARVPLKMRAHSFHQILPDCNLKANCLPRNSWSEKYKNSYNFEDSDRKTLVKFCTILEERTALRFFKCVDLQSFDKHSLCATHIHSAFGDGKRRAILLYVFRRAPCGEAYLLRFCREQSHNSAGAWSNW